MGHRVYAAALSAAVVLLVGGCSDEPEPKFADPTSEVPTSTSTSVEPVTNPPTSEPTDEQKESVQSFIRRWSVVERDMQNSGDSRSYRALSDGCEGCDGLASTVDRYYAAGGSIMWDGWTIKSIRRFDPKQIEYVVTVDSAPTRYRESRSGPVKRLSGGPAQWVIELRREGLSWVVTDKDELVD